MFFERIAHHRELELPGGLFERKPPWRLVIAWGKRCTRASCLHLSLHETADDALDLILECSRCTAHPRSTFRTVPHPVNLHARGLHEHVELRGRTFGDPKKREHSGELRRRDRMLYDLGLRRGVEPRVGRNRLRAIIEHTLREVVPRDR